MSNSKKKDFDWPVYFCQTAKSILCGFILL